MAQTPDEPLTLTVHSLPQLDQASARDAASTRAGRWKMLALLLVSAAPVIASYFTYYVIRPEGRRNYGELIDPQRPLPAFSGRDAQGQPVPLTALKDQWLLISVADSACGEACQQHLYLQRQLRETLGKEKDRLDWVWLRTGDAALPGHGGGPGAAGGRRATRDLAGARAGPSHRRPPVPGGPAGQLDDAIPRPARPQAGQARPGPPDARRRVLGPSGPAERRRAGANPLTLAMQTQTLYDLAPIARIMLLGVVIALGPLAWVWLRNRRAEPTQRLRVLTLVTLFLTFDLVLFGAFTRLTDSGLGCPDWPGCYGHLLWPRADHEIEDHGEKCRARHRCGGDE